MSSEPILPESEVTDPEASTDATAASQPMVEPSEQEVAAHMEAGAEAAETSPESEELPVE